jgi:hypothetical protein
MMKKLCDLVICLRYVHELRRLHTPIVERTFQQNFNYGTPWFHKVIFPAKYEMDGRSNIKFQAFKGFILAKCINA